MKEKSVLYQPEDRKICEDLLLPSRWKGSGKRSLNKLLILVGKNFLGVPYAANTIETEGGETLVVNLRQFDCFTFVENCVVLVRLIDAGKTSFEDYTAQLEKIRYRRGGLKGYSSRLHYFSDWLYDNREKGMVKDITAEIGGKPVMKEIHFMTKHPENYPALKNEASYREMLAVEKRLSGQDRSIIPKSGFGKFEGRIEDGNLIGITTNMEGLDVAHVGFAVWVKNHIHLLHASEKEGKVVLSENTLGHYLSAVNTRSGIVVSQVLAC
jgi:hypothetical protein